MSAPRSGEPSTFDKVLGASLLAMGTLLAVGATGAAIAALLSGNRHAAIGDFLLIALGLLALGLADSNGIDCLFGELRNSARALLGRKERIEISELPNELAEAIRPLMGRVSHLTASGLHDLLAQATAVMEERAAFARAERDAIERDIEVEQSRAAAAHLRRLTDEEKAILELSIYARAEADARAARDFESLEREIAALRDACKTYAEFYCHNNSHKDER